MKEESPGYKAGGLTPSAFNPIVTHSCPIYLNPPQKKVDVEELVGVGRLQKNR